MDTPIVLSFYIKPSSDPTVIRSAVLKDYFSKLTSNVEVLYPTQVHYGLLLCKSRRTEEKISNMRHTLSNGSTIHLSQLPRQLFQQIKCAVDGQIMQLNGTNTSLQQCLPFLHASGGKIHVNSDGSILLEGHIFILNSIHSYLVIKISKQQSNNTNESFDIRSGNLTTKVMTGKLIDQTVESIMVPVNDRYKIHRAFDRQIQSSSGAAFSNYLKEFATKSSRAREGEMISFSNRDPKIPAKFFLAFIVPRLSNTEGFKDQSTIDSFQLKYEQMIYRAFQTIDQYGITSLAMPVLEPSVKNSHEKRHANEMTVRAMISAIRQFSQNVSIKLKRIIIVDHQVQMKRMNKRVKKYQKQIQSKMTSNNNIDLDTDTGHSFANIFGVPKIPEIVSTTSESDDDIEPEEYQLPYTDLAKS